MMKIKTSVWFFGLIIFLASLFASRDLFRPGYFPMHDDLQVGRLYQMDLCIKDGQFPCRWVPDMGYSYGYPLFNYYPPFPYYLGEVFHLVGLSYIDSVKLLFIVGFLVSGILMFLFTRKLWGDWGGLLSAVLYLWAPYHSLDVYVRGALNEFWALAFLPGIFWAMTEIIEKKKPKAKNIALLALFFALLLLSHNLMALVFAPPLAVFGLLLIRLKKKDFLEKLEKLIFGGIWGFGLAAFFTLPVLLEKKYVHVETMFMGYFNYLAHYVSIGKLLFTRFWGYGSSGWLQETGMPFQVGLPHWPLATLVFLLVLLLFLAKKVNREVLFIAFYFFALALFTLFLVHPRSVFIWQRVPVLAYLQFPWRFLTLVIFSLSALGGGMIFLIGKNRLKVFTAFVLSLSVILLNFTFFRVEKIIQINDEEKLFSPLGQLKLQTDAIFDYLPKVAKAPPASSAPEAPLVVEGEAEISRVEKGSHWYRFKAKVDQSAKIQIPLYDFPGWKVWANESEVSTRHDNDLGLLTINLGEGDHLIEAKLTDTPVRKAANFISLAAWLLLPVLMINSGEIIDWEKTKTKKRFIRAKR